MPDRTVRLVLAAVPVLSAADVARPKLAPPLRSADAARPVAARGDRAEDCL